MSIILQFLFGLLQGILPDIISTTKKALSKESLCKFLDVNKDGKFDLDDLKIITAGRKIGWWLAVISIILLSGFLAYFLHELYLIKQHLNL